MEVPTKNFRFPLIKQSTTQVHQIHGPHFFSHSAMGGVHPFRHFFRHFRFWRFRHPYKTLVPPLYFKSPRSLKNLSVSALIFSVSSQIVYFSAPTVSVSAQKQKNYLSSHLGVIFISSIKFTTSTSASLAQPAQNHH